MRLFRFMDWPLRAKMAALLAIASFLPLAISAYGEARETWRRRLESATALLAARADHVGELIDGFHRVYRISAETRPSSMRSRTSARP